MSHGWIKNRYFRDEVGRGLRKEHKTGGTVRAWRLLKYDSSGDLVEAGVGDKDVAAIHADSDAPTVVSGALAKIAIEGVVSMMADIKVNEGEKLKTYATGKVGPALVASLAGADISAGGQTGIGFTNQPANDAVEVVSSSASDVSQVITIFGTTNGTTTVVKEEVTLNGTTPVATTKSDWGEILGVEIKLGTPLSVGTVTVREASGDLAITTLSAGTRRSGVYVVAAASQRGFLTTPDAVADGATTKVLGLVGTDSAGTELLAAVALSGTTLVHFSSAFRTITKILVGDVEATRDATVTIDANVDSGELIVGRALADGAAGSTFLALFQPRLMEDSSIGVAKLGPDVEQVAAGTLSSAQILALNATPITVVAAPGAGKALIYEGCHLMLDYNSTAYAGIAAGEDLAIKYTDASGAQVAEVETTGFLDQTNDEHRWAYPAGNTGAVLPSVEPVEDAPLVAHMLVGEITTGNSPVHYRVHYRVIDLDIS